MDKKIFFVIFLMACAMSGCIDSPGDGVKVITVGASDGHSKVAEFSGSGPTRDGRTKPTVLGPGVDIVSTVPPGLEKLDYIDVYYARESGTSLSTPAAAGVAALILQKDKNLTPAGVKAALVKGAHKLNNSIGEEYEEYYQGAGLIDANKSIQALSQSSHLCGVIPDHWIAGKWAFPGGGKSISPGFDVGADRLQKKIYAMAPGDEDWTTRFVFFTNSELTNVSVHTKGDIANWLTVMALPSKISSNDQNVFGATIHVPDDAKPGRYDGSVEIMDDGEVICTVPVSAEVAKPLEINGGSSTIAESIDSNQWQYYYMDVPVGSKSISFDLGWSGSEQLDLFLFAPTCEYYPAEESVRSKNVIIENPPSGKWLIVIHAPSLTEPYKYVLDVERSQLEVDPPNLSVGPILPGQSQTASIDLSNGGLPLENLTFNVRGETVDNVKFDGSVENGRTWSKNIEVDDGMSSISATLTWDMKDSDLDLRLYDPDGDLAAKSEGYNVEEVVEEYEPDPGIWRIEVRGYDVPVSRKQYFDLTYSKHYSENWTWIKTSGPKYLEPGQNATLNVVISVPSNTPSKEMTGHLEISSSNQSFQIPLSLIVSGAYINGIKTIDVPDSDKDGFFDDLSIGVEIHSEDAGNYRLEGGLTDCSSNLIQWLKTEGVVKGNSIINLNASGKRIWRQDGCVPLKVGPLFLFNDHGDLISEYNESVSLDQKPEQFQPPPAYFNYTFSNLSTVVKGKLSSISVGIDIRVVKAGNYKVEGVFEDDKGNELGRDDKFLLLKEGIQTVSLDLNPTKFIMKDTESQVHLKDLVLSLNGEEMDRMDEAWSTGFLTRDDFTSERRTVVIS